MFRALTYPSSGGQIVLSHTVQPFTESDDTRCCDNTICPPEDGHVKSDDTRCCDNTICPPEDGHVNARNMSRIVM